jgi:hypothetical protein
MKKYADSVKDHAQEQLQNIEEKNQELDAKLGQSSLLDNWDYKVNLPDPIFDRKEDDDSRPILANVIKMSIGEAKKKKKINSPDDNVEEIKLDEEDEDKSFEPLIKPE